MLRNILKALRPKQWVKNILIFAGVVFDRKLGDPTSLFVTIEAAGLFSLLASAVYLLNDISDLESDREHPTKKNRPVASGALPIPLAWGIAISLLLVVLFFGYRLSPLYALTCVIYAVLNLAYSRWIKHIVILDVLILAGFYVIRVIIGLTVISVVRFSPWLFLATIFLALFMGVGKRRAELINAQQSGNSTRKVLEFYTLDYLDQIIMIVLTSTIMTYSLYSFFAPNLPENHVTMLTIPFVIYGVFRYLYLLRVQKHGEAPEEIVLSDRPFQINLLLWGAAILLIFYFF
jgi:4-hydroxybenzoate polyprenyltransferase